MGHFMNAVYSRKHVTVYSRKQSNDWSQESWSQFLETGISTALRLFTFSVTA